jgi:hypothetical protein
VAEPKKVRLVDRIQHLGYRPLDNLVFERGHAERPAACKFLEPQALAAEVPLDDIGDLAPPWQPWKGR